MPCFCRCPYLRSGASTIRSSEWRVTEARPNRESTRANTERQPNFKNSIRKRGSIDKRLDRRSRACPVFLAAGRYYYYY